MCVLLADNRADDACDPFGVGGEPGVQDRAQVRGGSVAELGSALQTWLAAHVEGIACVISTADIDVSGFGDPSRVRSLTPELSKGLEFDLVVLVDPEDFGEGIEGAVDRYVAMTRATQQLVILTGTGHQGGQLPT